MLQREMVANNSALHFISQLVYLLLQTLMLPPSVLVQYMRTTSDALIACIVGPLPHGNVGYLYCRPQQGSNVFLIHFSMSFTCLPKFI